VLIDNGLDAVISFSNRFHSWVHSIATRQTSSPSSSLWLEIIAKLAYLDQPHIVTRHRTSTSMYSLTFRVCFMLPLQIHPIVHN